MLGESVVIKLAQTIKVVVESLGVDKAALMAAAGSGAAPWYEVLPSYLALGVTVVFAVFVIKTWREAQKANRITLIAIRKARRDNRASLAFAAEQAEEQDFVRQKDRLLEEMQAIMEAVSSLFPKIAELIQPTEIQNRLFSIYKIATWSFFLSSRLPITLGYIEKYAEMLKSKIDKTPDESLSESNRKELSRFHDKVGLVFKKLALLSFSRTRLTARYRVEKSSAINYNKYVDEGRDDKFELLEKAMVNLRKMPPEPYDFSQDVEASPYQPKK